MTLCSINYHSIQSRGKWRWNPTHSYRGKQMQISDHLHVTDPGTHWIRGWLVPQTGLDVVKDRKIYVLVEIRTQARMSSSSQPSHGNDWREVLTPLCPQESLICRRNVGLLSKVKQAIISRVSVTVRSYITSYKMHKYVLSFGPAKLHFFHKCLRLCTYLYSHIHFIYLRRWLGSVWPSVRNSQNSSYKRIWLVWSVHPRHPHIGKGQATVPVMATGQWLGAGHVRRYKTTVWTTEDRGSFPVRGIRNCLPLHNLHTGCMAFLTSNASHRSSVPENRAAEAWSLPTVCF
jgi:hypothetical protein